MPGQVSKKGMICCEELLSGKMEEGAKLKLIIMLENIIRQRFNNRSLLPPFR